MGPEFTHLLDSLGWAVLHSLWQGGIAFILVAMMRIFWRNGSPALRYAAQMLVLIGCVAAFFVTFAIYAGATSPSSLRASGGEGGQLIFGGLISAFEPTQAEGGFNWPDVSALTPYIAVLWFVGFMALSLRYAFAYGQAQQLRVLGVSEAPMEWKLRFLQLIEKTGISKSVKLHISPHIDGPMTMGFLKPVVLVPTGFLTGIPSDQVEAILLHELAHIRRHDYLFNLLQTGIRTVLFYHPAIHIISRWIDRDREQACDDVAVAKGHNAKALLKGLAALRLQNESFAMAASGKNEEMPLLDRLTRLAGQKPSRPRKPEHVLMSLLSAMMIGTIYVGTVAKADAHPHPKPPKLTVDDVDLPDTVVPPKPAEPLKPGQAPAVLVAPGPMTPGTAMLPPLPPTPPALPALPPLKFSGQINEGILQSFIETDKAIYSAHKIAMNQYKTALKSYMKSEKLDADDREDLMEDYEDYIDDVEEIFEDRREAVEDAYRDYQDARRDAENDWTDEMEARIEREVERVVARAERDVEKSVRDTQREVFRQQKEMQETAKRNRQRAEQMQRQAEIQQKRALVEAEKSRTMALKNAEKARSNALKNKKQKNKHEAFRDVIMTELLADKIIKSKSETVFLTHYNGKMQVNGDSLQKELRDKYCTLWSEAGFKDDDTEVTIKPGSLQIFTDKKNGKHTTKITYGTWKQ